MKNKRRANTAFEYAGTETGSVTYTVTLYPDDFEEDADLVELLEKKGKRRLRSIYIRNALIAYHSGKAVAVESTPRERPKSRMANSEPIPMGDVDNSTSEEAAKSLGLKLGRK